MEKNEQKVIANAKIVVRTTNGVIVDIIPINNALKQRQGCKLVL